MKYGLRKKPLHSIVFDNGRKQELIFSRLGRKRKFQQAVTFLKLKNTKSTLEPKLPQQI